MGKLPGVRTILPAWFDYLEESFSCKEVKLKTFLPSVRTCCLPLVSKKQQAAVIILYTSVRMNENMVA